MYFTENGLQCLSNTIETAQWVQGAKKVVFIACHSGKLKLTFTIPNIISTSPKNVLMSRLISQFFCNLNSSNNFTCTSGKLITEFTSPIAKSTSHRLLHGHYFLCTLVCDLGYCIVQSEWRTYKKFWSGWRWWWWWFVN